MKGAAFLLPFPRHSGLRAGIHFWVPCGCTVMPVLRLVAFHELIQIRSLQRVCFEGKMHIGAQVIDP